MTAWGTAKLIVAAAQTINKNDPKPLQQVAEGHDAIAYA